jgi:hypothetical protein
LRSTIAGAVPCPYRKPKTAAQVVSPTGIGPACYRRAVPRARHGKLKGPITRRTLLHCPALDEALGTLTEGGGWTVARTSRPPASLSLQNWRTHQTRFRGHSQALLFNQWPFDRSACARGACCNGCACRAGWQWLRSRRYCVLQHRMRSTGVFLYSIADV